MLKNTAGQYWLVFAFNLSTGEPVTGDAANITAKIAIDGGALSAISDINPTEVEDGYYRFALSQPETNGGGLEIYPESATSGVQVIGVPGVIHTAPIQAIASSVASNLTGQSLSVSSPVTETGELGQLVRGNDYLESLGPSRTLSWTFDLPGADLTDATCYFGARKTNRGSWLIEGTLTPDPEVANRYSAQFDLPSSATVDAKPDTYPWQVEVRTADGEKLTKITGTVPLIDSTTY